MEPKTAVQIFNETKEKHTGELPIANIITLSMKEYGKQAVRMALEEAAKNVYVTGDCSDFDMQKIEDSILSLEQSIIEKLK